MRLSLPNARLALAPPSACALGKLLAFLAFYVFTCNLGIGGENFQETL